MAPCRIETPELTDIGLAVQCDAPALGSGSRPPSEGQLSSLGLWNRTRGS